MKYRISVGWQLFSYFFGGVMMVMGIFIAQKAMASGVGSPLFLAVFGLLFTLFGLAFIINTIKTLVIVDDETVTVTTILGTRSLPLAEIRGYGTGEKNSFYLIPKNAGKNLTIPTNLSGRDQLLSLFTARYPDVNAIQLEEATTHLLDDERFGSSREERASRLKNTTRLALFVNFVPMVLLLVSVFSKSYYEPVMWMILCVPWLVAFITRLMRGMVSAVPKRNNPSPSFFSALVASAVAALVGGVRPYSLYGLDGRAFGIFIAAGLITFLLYRAICGGIFEQEEKKQWLYLGFGLLFCVYGAGLVIFTNCFYDRSMPKIFRAALTDKHISHGKSDNYYLTLSAWGRYRDDNDFSVSSTVYGSVERGDSLRISLFDGKWGLPWYRIHSSATVITSNQQ